MTEPRILVTGGTGTLGRAVVNSLIERGHRAVVASRGPQPAGPLDYAWRTVDYATGAGLDEAVAGVDAIVVCTNQTNAVDADRAVIEAAKRAGGPHLVYISIVGVDRIRLGYYGIKLQAEGLIERSGLPWTVLRTTQFHDLIPQMYARLSKSPVVPVPAGVRLQPIEVREVAARLAELATGDPAGRVPDMGGPQIRHVADLVREYLAIRGLRRLLVPMWFPGKAFRDYRDDRSLIPDRAVGKVTYEEYLAERFAPAGG